MLILFSCGIQIGRQDFTRNEYHRFLNLAKEVIMTERCVFVQLHYALKKKSTELQYVQYHIGEIKCAILNMFNPLMFIRNYTNWYIKYTWCLFISLIQL